MKMKKRISSIMLVLTLVVTAVIVPQTPAVAYAGEQPISVTINGGRVVFPDQNPVIVDGRTLVPIRGVFEKLGFDVGWAPDTRQVILTSDEYTIVITIGSATVTVNGANRTLDVPAQIINDRTMLPIRAVVESVGYFVDWDAETRTVIITDDGSRHIWNLRLSSQNPVNSADSVMINWAAQEVYVRTNGAIAISHFPAGILGDYIPVLQEVMRGTVDIVVGTAPTTVDGRMAMLHIPYLITSYEEGKRIWTRGSNFFDILSEIADDNNLVLLGILPGGLMGIGTTVPMNPATVWDFDRESAELRLRLPPLWILQTLADGMQLTNAHAIPFADVFPAMMTGVVDGWLGGGPELNYNFARDAISYFYDHRYMDDSLMIFMNKDIYNLIPENYRNILAQVFEEASIRMIDEQTEISAYFIQRLKDHGITVFQPTDAQREAMQEAAIRRIWPALYDEFGQDVMDRLKEDVRQ